MVFSSLIFLIFFLPITGLLYCIPGQKFKNGILLAASLFFYAWGEPHHILLILLSITVNFFLGLWIDRCHGSWRKPALCVSVIFNLGLLGWYKYFNFAVFLLNRLPGIPPITAREIALPIGISFYTFQILSYLIDLYRGQIQVQRNWGKLALYISFFPQLVAGPIVRYHDVAQEIDQRVFSSAESAYGVRRFCFGLSKKVIIANPLGNVVDRIYALPLEQMSSPLAWTAAIFYMLQIYYDFSGYSDMAIGLAQIFGFHFRENFLFPYTALSIRDFWRKWHVSLSTWFREYLYIPLGGNRKGTFRTYLNLTVVFFCTGLWHGASLHFVFWGLYHGFFSILERLLAPRLSFLSGRKWVRYLQHLYAMLVVMIGWIFFRVPGIRFSFAYTRLLFVPTESPAWNYSEIVSPQLILLGLLAVLLCGPLQQGLNAARFSSAVCLSEKSRVLLSSAAAFVLLLLSLFELVNNTYNPFIYFRF